jgi:hypothetical protein
VQLFLRLSFDVALAHVLPERRPLIARSRTIVTIAGPDSVYLIVVPLAAFLVFVDFLVTRAASRHERGGAGRADEGPTVQSEAVEAQHHRSGRREAHPAP